MNCCVVISMMANREQAPAMKFWPGVVPKIKMAQMFSQFPGITLSNAFANFDTGWGSGVPLSKMIRENRLIPVRVHLPGVSTSTDRETRSLTKALRPSFDVNVPARIQGPCSTRIELQDSDIVIKRDMNRTGRWV